jgi:hypothetical protein
MHLARFSKKPKNQPENAPSSLPRQSPLYALATINAKRYYTPVIL